MSKHTANIITLARIALVPLFMFFAGREGSLWLNLALLTFLIASVTDAIDGYVARRFSQVSNFGKFIDPLADKLLVAGALLALMARGQIGAWAVMLILTREFAVTSLRLVAACEGQALAAGWPGKLKMIVQIVCVCVMLSVLGPMTLGGMTLNDLSVWVMTVVTVWSGIMYFIKYRALFHKRKIDKGRRRP